MGEASGGSAPSSAEGRQASHRLRVGKDAWNATRVDPKHGLSGPEAALAGQPQQSGHPLSGIDGIESKSLSAGGQPNGLLGAAVSKAVSARAPVASHLDQLVAPAVPDAQEDGDLPPDAADIRPDALGLRVDVDADGPGGMAKGQQPRDKTRLRPGTAAGPRLHDTGARLEPL